MRGRGDRECTFRTTFLSAAVVIILSRKARKAGLEFLDDHLALGARVALPASAPWHWSRGVRDSTYQ
jgi:hypothetical protein